MGINPYYRNPRTDSSFDESEIIGSAARPSFAYFDIYSTPVSSGENDPVQSWNGLLRLINARFSTDYFVDFFPNGSHSSLNGSALFGTPTLLTEVEADYKLGRNSILRVRDCLRQINPWAVFKPVPRVWSETCVRDLVIGRWVAHEELVEDSGIVVMETPVAFVQCGFDMGLEMGEQFFNVSAQSGAPAILHPQELLDRWAEEDRWEDGLAEPRGSVTFNPIDEPVTTGGTWSIYTGRGDIENYSGLVFA